MIAPDLYILVGPGFVSAATTQGFEGGSWTGSANPKIPERPIFQIRNGANTTGPIVQEERGRALCGWIGAEVRPMTAPFAASLGMTVPYGAIFDRPEAGSTAANAGIEAGDVITAINGSPLMRSSDFATLIATKAPGTLVYLNTWRNGTFSKVTLTLGSSKCSDEISMR